ncbi:MAG: SDR family oxidoreductase [Bacteriovoracaceae bacterium]|nr:SDR family oxidoreductase [Bacteriovoracaceae bacterium]
MDFLGIKDKTFFITGVANKKSVAYFSAKVLEEAGAKLIFSVQREEQISKVEKLFPESEIFIMDVENEETIKQIVSALESRGVVLSGLLHSIAFANLMEPKPFHETKWEDWAQADRISCFSLVAISGALKNLFVENASVVTISISDTKATSYGYLGPIKASLDTSVAYLAKSFSDFSKVRFNAVCAGPLKTSASAGIPGYIDNYIFAEKLTMRKEALKTDEVANTVAFLLSPRSSGINGIGLRVDAGMRANSFDEEVVKVVANNL